MLRPDRRLLVEPLEPRLLLSADLIPTEPVAPLQSSPVEQAIVVSLNQQGSTVQDNGGSGTLTQLAATGEIQAGQGPVWEPYVPSAGQTNLSIQTQTAGTTAKITMAFPDSGYRVNDWGTIERQGNVFVVDAQTEHGNGFVLCVLTYRSHDYDLGVLTPGNYTFVFKAWGQTVESKNFGIDVVDGDWVSYVPVAEHTTVLAQTQTSGTTTAKVTLTVGGTGYRVQDWGTVRREGNTFYVDAQPQKRTKGIVLPTFFDVSHDYDLGALAPGDYTFVFQAWGHLVERQDFAVTEDGAAQWAPCAPTPEQMDLSRQTSAAGTTAKVTLTFPHTAHRIDDWGSVQRQANVFYVNAQMEAWTGPRPAQTTVFSHDYDLGALTPGEYTFVFEAGGRPVRSLNFVVAEGASPVYRFWAPSNNAHFYTISEEEKNNLIVKYPDYWTFEGIAFYAYPEGRQPTGSKPVYRFWSPAGKEHFYTIGEEEKAGLATNYSSYWTLEGVAFYVYPESHQATGFKPVYRFWSPVGGLHFYTISEQEKDTLVANYSYYWTLEGVAWQTLTLDSFGLTTDSQVEPSDGHAGLQAGSLPDLPGMRPTNSDPANLAGQIIYLDFDGQRNVTYNGPVTVGPFDVPAFQTVGALAGQEQVIIDAVLGRLQRMFAGCGVIFTLAKPPDGIDYSTTYVGGDGSPFEPYGSFLGLAEQIDSANAVRNDDALVFTDRLGGGTPDLNLLIGRLTGIIAHEVGHLFGYIHV